MSARAEFSPPNVASCSRLVEVDEEAALRRARSLVAQSSKWLKKRSAAGT
jgi:hypothetical protein